MIQEKQSAIPAATPSALRRPVTPGGVTQPQPHEVPHDLPVQPQRAATHQASINYEITGTTSQFIELKLKP